MLRWPMRLGFLQATLLKGGDPSVNDFLGNFQRLARERIEAGEFVRR